MELSLNDNVIPECSLDVGARISKKEKEGVRNKEVNVRLSIFLAKQMHFCLANMISKYRSKTRNT